MSRFLWMPKYIRNLREIVHVLSDPDKEVRHHGLLRMDVYLEANEDKFVSWNYIFHICHERLLGCIRDPCVKNRDYAISIVKELYVKYLPRAHRHIVPLWHILNDRLNSREFEPEEKQRLQLLQLMWCVQNVYQPKYLEKHVKTSIGILAKMLKEEYAPIVRICCDIVQQLMQKNTKIMKNQSTPIIKALINNDVQNLIVRQYVFQCIGTVLMNCEKDTLVYFTPILVDRLLLENSTLRKSIIIMGAEWSQTYIDRYDHYHILLPLNLIGLNDEEEIVSEVAIACWRQVGLKYQSENREFIEFSSAKTKVEELTSYPENAIRPSLGCRLLVQRYIVKLMPEVLRYIYNNKSQFRIQGAKLLGTVILHAEQDSKLVLFLILGCMFHAARYNDQRIVTNIIQAAHYLAFFVQPNNWWHIFKRSVGEELRCRHLVVLTALMNATPSSQLQEILREVEIELIRSATLPTNMSRYYEEEMMNCKNVISRKRQQNGSVAHVEIIDE